MREGEGGLRGTIRRVLPEVGFVGFFCVAFFLFFGLFLLRCFIFYFFWLSFSRGFRGVE